MLKKDSKDNEVEVEAEFDMEELVVE